jgi:hypothetical protein
MMRAPRLAIAWEPRWAGFRSALKPALEPSKPRLNGECSLAHQGARSTFISLLLHASIVVFIIRMGSPPPSSSSIDSLLPENATIIYYSGALPAIQDASGAKAGSAWSTGGRALRRPGQDIKISSPSEPAEAVAQVDHLNLPRRISAPANFVALAQTQAPSIAVATQPDIRTAEIHAPVAPAAQPMSESVRQMQTPNLQAQVIPPPIEIPVSKSVDLARLTIPSDLTPFALPPVPRRKALTSTPNADVTAPELNQAADPKAVGQIVSSAPPSPAMLASPEPVSAPISGARLPNVTRTVGYVISSEVGKDLAAPDLSNLAGGSFSAHGVPSTGSGHKGNGSGTSSGDGTGAAVNQVPGPGGALTGTGLGKRETAAGNSSGMGKGGSGEGGVQNTGITINGDTIQIGSFAAAAPSVSTSTKMPLGPRQRPGVTIVATPRSGGAVNRYGALPGSKVYTIYLDTPAGLATLEYATAEGQNQSFADELTAPEPITTDLPPNLKGASFVLRCKMDRDGIMHGFQVLEGIKKNLAPALIAALENWRFRPVLQNGESVEVDAIVGLNVGTH